MNFRKISKLFYDTPNRLGRCLLTKKNKGKKSRDTVPLSPCLRVSVSRCLHVSMSMSPCFHVSKSLSPVSTSPCLHLHISMPMFPCFRNSTNGKGRQLPLICYKQKMETVNLRLFAASGNGDGSLFYLVGKR
jgi:hypothetical protein